MIKSMSREVRFFRIICAILSGLIILCLIFTSYDQHVKYKTNRKECMNPYKNWDEKCGQVLSLDEQSELRWNRILVILNEILKEIRLAKQCS